MKIVLFSGYGSGATSCEAINKILNSCKFPRNRMTELVDLLESLPDSTEEAEKAILQTGPNGGFEKLVEKKSLLKLMSSGRAVYFAAGADNNPPVSMTIEDINVDSPWTIKEYDGAEYVESYAYKMVDPVVNYVKPKN